MMQILNKFLSSNTQDFIEVTVEHVVDGRLKEFLSSNTQDFIEVNLRDLRLKRGLTHS